MINKRNEAWLDRDRRKEMAMSHTQYVHAKYYDDTLECVKNTSVQEAFKINDTDWSDSFTLNSTIIPLYPTKTKFVINAKSTVDAIIDGYKQKRLEEKSNVSREGFNRLAALNFASFNNPGGKFMEGSMAQEESLCHESNLYNVLLQFNNTFYKNNKTCKNNSLYHNNSLYTKDVIFIKDGKIIAKSDIITCAAPNTHAAMKYHNIPYKQCLDAMINRIDHVLKVAHDNRVSHLILGAYGCGVFGNNPTDVAAAFMTLLTIKYKNVFDIVEFSIPYSINNDNNEKFDEVIRKFEAYEHRDTKALDFYPSVSRLIGEDRPWLKV